jgi:hypothetical protein
VGLPSPPRAGESGVQSRTVSQNAVKAAPRYADASLVARWRRMINETDVVARHRRHGDRRAEGKSPRRRLRQRLRHPQLPADMGYRSINDKMRSRRRDPRGRYRSPRRRTLHITAPSR